jgi:hypothetical protein
MGNKSNTSRSYSRGRMTNRLIAFDYPTPDERQSGCKVGWLIYRDRAKANEAAAVAVREANVRAEQGFDFGYCSPGWIDSVERNGERWHRVCVP